jgi:hypothetical protein
MPVHGFNDFERGQRAAETRRGAAPVGDVVEELRELPIPRSIRLRVFPDGRVGRPISGRIW